MRRTATSVIALLTAALAASAACGDGPDTDAGAAGSAGSGQCEGLPKATCALRETNESLVCKGTPWGYSRTRNGLSLAVQCSIDDDAVVDERRSLERTPDQWPAAPCDFETSIVYPTGTTRRRLHVSMRAVGDLAEVTFDDKSVEPVAIDCVTKGPDAGRF